MSTGAYELGYAAAKFNEAMRRVGEQLKRDLLVSNDQLAREGSWAELERRREARYRRRIELERQKGRAYVRREAARVRRELGLNR